MAKLTKKAAALAALKKAGGTNKVVNKKALAKAYKMNPTMKPSKGGKMRKLSYGLNKKNKKDAAYLKAVSGKGGGGGQ